MKYSRTICALMAVVAFLTAVFASETAFAAVKSYRVKVVKEYPHDTGSYTQGLFFRDGDGK